MKVENWWTPTAVVFSGGAHGRKESGVYWFWTAQVKRGRIVGRTRACKNPLAVSPFKSLIGQLEYLRPSTWKEILDWRMDHQRDAEYMEYAIMPRGNTKFF